MTLKLGKLQALAALTQYAPLLVPKPKPDLTAGERQRYEEKCEQLARELDDSIDEQWHLEQELDALRKAQAEARTAQEDVTPVAAAAAAAPPPSPPGPADTAQEPPSTRVRAPVPAYPLGHRQDRFPTSAEARVAWSPGGFPGWR